MDDDDDLRRLTEMSLVHVGKFECYTAESGEAALQLLHHQPDLILLDVMMPGMDGIETFREIRKAGCDATIIFLTGRSSVEESGDLIALGALGVIAKPFNPMGLPDDIRKMVEGT